MRLYTLAEARTLLPEIRPVLESIRMAFGRLRGLQAAAAVEAGTARADGHATFDAIAATAAEGEVDALRVRLQEGVDRLTTLGIELKDPSRGLIDFHHERDGELVYLCYELGEDDITAWHPLDSGFAGRRPL